jgi:hypothetical protein
LNEYDKIYGNLTKREEKLVRNDFDIPVLVINPCLNEEGHETMHMDYINIGMRIKV